MRHKLGMMVAGKLPGVEQMDAAGRNCRKNAAEQVAPRHLC